MRDGASEVTQGVAGGVAGLTINDDGTFSFDPQNAAYDDLTEGDIRRFDVVYALTGDGQTVEQNLVIEITQTNEDRRAEILKGANAYDFLSAGDTQEIDIQYQVEDEDGATATNRFSVYVNGTNDAPVATFTAAQSVTEDSVNAFATDDGAGNYTFALATFIPAVDATLSLREFAVTDAAGDLVVTGAEIPGLTGL